MEVLRYPHPECSKFIFYGGFAFGPVDENLQTNFEILPFQSAESSLIEGKGLFRENSVTHNTSDGEISYSPAQQFMRAAPSAYYPDQVEIPTPGNNWRRASLGLCENSAYAMHRPGGTASQVRHMIARRNQFGCWTIYMADASHADYLGMWVRYEIVSLAIANSIQVNMTITQSVYVGRIMMGGTALNRLSYETLAKIIPSFPASGLSKDTAFIYPLDKLKWLMPAEIREYTTQVCSAVSFGQDILPEKHFGELASDASAKMNSNNVNMLEFLRDIKHPKRMIPKLRNLASLKSWSSDYLAIQYGVLPTMRDLIGIYEAVLKREPHYDRAGITTVQKAYKASKVINDVEVTLEQHIKLAIQKEDSGLDEAISQLESIGFLPTFENMWDLIPFSFVVDWFVNIGKMLSRVDGIHRLMRFNVQYSTMSTKRTAKTTFGGRAGVPITGFISLRSYHRWTTIKVPLPPLSLQPSTNGDSHWLEASALLMSRAKK